MNTLGAWLSLLLIAVALEATAGVPKMHYHRYMLSDYRRQHSNLTQPDYLPLPRPHYGKDHEIIPKVQKARFLPDVPMVKIDDYGREVMLYEVLVRVYLDCEFQCMATLVSQQIAITVGTCFMPLDIEQIHGAVSIKTSTNINTTVSILPNDEHSPTLLLTLVLDIPLPAYDIQLKFCSYKLEPGITVSQSTYIRSTQMVQQHHGDLLSLSDCRVKLNDPLGHIVTDDMICVVNNAGQSCQNTKGNPLIHDGMLCGINVLGHNCPKPVGVDLFVSVMDEVALMEILKKRIMNTKFDSEIP